MKEKVLNQIKINKLENLEYEFIIAQLCVLNNKPFHEMKEILDSLIEEGLFSLNNDIKEEDNTQLILEAENMLKRKDEKHSRKIKNLKLEGRLQGTKMGYAFLLPFDKTYEDVFISSANLHGAINNDIVSVQLLKTGTKKLEGKVVAVLERGNDKVIGKIFINKTYAMVMPDDVKFGKDVSVPISKLNGASNGDKVVVKINKYYPKNKNPEGEIIEVLGKPNEIETEIKAIIRSYNLYETFPKKVLEVAKQLPSEIKEINGRKDLTGLNCFTIDGDDTRDIDDAISISKSVNGIYTLGVHIADVSEYVKFNSILDKEAFKRGTSVYFPNLVLPMLPRELSNGICSLNEGEKRLTLSVLMDINTAGEVVKYNIYQSVIKSRKQFTYNVVQKILDGDKEECENNVGFVHDLLTMNELNKILIKARQKRGEINFDLPETKIVLDNLGGVVDIIKAPRDDSHRLIESFMVIANETIATHFNNLKVPFVYRVHETPDSEKISNFIRIASNYGVTTTANPEKIKPMDLQMILKQVEDLDCKFMINNLCLRSLKKAKYSEECLGHFGLASLKYCHFTSPIRRYPDLTIHRIIKMSLNNELQNEKLFKEQKQFVIASALNSSDREQNADKVERDVDDLYKVYYMKNHIGEEYDGIVSGVTNFGVFVQLDNTVEGMIRITDLPQDGYMFDDLNVVLKGMKNTYTLGKKVRVKCVNADISTKEIDFVLI